MANSKQKEPETEVSKTVTIVGYVKDGETVSPREWADRYSSKDYFKREVKEQKNYKLDVNGVELSIVEGEYKELEGNCGEGVSLLVEDESEETWKHDEGHAGYEFTREVTHEIEPDLPEGWEWRPRWGKVKNEDGDTVVKRHAYNEEMRLLKHPSEITPEEPYVEDETEYTAVKIRISVDEVSEDDMEMLDDEIIQPVVDGVAKHDEIERVRWTDCEVTKTEKGACMRL